ncbi:MAG: GNAT family N-acetyltransferase [Phycisphaerales bacterium JB037]
MSRDATDAVLRAGERVYLRHPVEGDAAEFVGLRRASRGLFELWEPGPGDYADPVPDGFSRGQFERFLAASDLPEAQRHLICARDSGAIVGQVSLTQIFRGPFCNAVMGYWVGVPFQRRGYASEGVRLAIARAFEDLGLHRVEANVIPENVASVGVVRAAGMRLEGHSPHYLRINGAWRGHDRYAITREDWGGGPAAG